MPEVFSIQLNKRLTIIINYAFDNDHFSFPVERKFLLLIFFRLLYTSTNIYTEGELRKTTITGVYKSLPTQCYKTGQDT